MAIPSLPNVKLLKVRATGGANITKEASYRDKIVICSIDRMRKRSNCTLNQSYSSATVVACGMADTDVSTLQGNDAVFETSETSETPHTCLHISSHSHRKDSSSEKIIKWPCECCLICHSQISAKELKTECNKHVLDTDDDTREGTDLKMSDSCDSSKLLEDVLWINTLRTYQVHEESERDGVHYQGRAAQRKQRVYILQSCKSVNRACPPNRMFTCTNRTQGQCNPLQKHCDGIPDCRDGSDELNCPCLTGQFKCKNGVCIPKIHMCNGINECFDGSDEMVCPSQMYKQGEFRCNSSMSRVDCVPASKQCDGFDDCGDNSDEELDICQCQNKTKPTCDANMFQCAKGDCIYKIWRCDRDGSDEKNCKNPIFGPLTLDQTLEKELVQSLLQSRVKCSFKMRENLLDSMRLQRKLGNFEVLSVLSSLYGLSKLVMIGQRCKSIYQRMVLENSVTLSCATNTNKDVFFLQSTRASHMLQMQEEAKPRKSEYLKKNAKREGCKVTEASSTRLTVHLPEDSFQDLKNLKQGNKPVKVLVTDVMSDTERQLLSIACSKPDIALSTSACPIDGADAIDYCLNINGFSLMNESKVSKERGTAKNKLASFHMVGNRGIGSYRDKSDLNWVKQLGYQVGVPSRNICPENGSFKIQQEMEEKDCHHIRKLTWLPLDQLPVPQLDLTIALVHSQADVILKRIAKGETVGAQESMKYEILRVCTYRNYPSENKPFRILLASAGLYFASENDEVVCYCCGLRKSGWNESDKPHEIHKQLKPSCDFFIRNESVNTPIPELTEDSLVKFRALEEAISSTDALPQSQSEAAAGNHGHFDLNTSESPHYRFFTPPPKHPQYAVQSVRLESFKGWPTNIPQTAPIMAECGYYYAGFGDCVRCFHCGIGLRHWTEEDYPWVEHARWSKDCAYLRQMKGEEFIQNVHLAIEEDEEPEDLIPATPSGKPADMNQVTPNEESNQILLTDPAQSVLEMGYQPRIIKKAIDIILHSEGRSAIRAQKIMETIFMLEERSNNLEQGVSNMSISGAAANTEVPSQNSSGTSQIQNESGSQIQNTVTDQAAQSSSTTNPSHGNDVSGQTHNISSSQAHENTASGQTSRSITGHTKSNTDIKLQAQKGIGETSRAKSATTTPVKQNATSPNSSPQSSLEDKLKGAASRKSQSPRDTTKIKEENQKLKEQTICKICLDKPVSIVFLPCGHLVTCAECAPAMRKCPICRAVVKGTVKAFMS